MMIRIKWEHRWLKEFVSRNRVDAIISDNRFGFYAKGIPSVFITHQLAVRTGLGNWMDRRAMKRNYAMIRPFTEVWVPDNGTGYSIAGTLSRPEKLPAPPVKYIGGLSRFELCDTVPGKMVIDNNALRASKSDGSFPRLSAEAEISNYSSVDLLIILSGPEPQRTVFEQLLRQQLTGFNGSVAMVLARPSASGELIITSSTDRQLTTFSHLPANLLNQLVCKAKLVISRTGYTTVMDLLKTKKRSILIPTPGQAEQEYLAGHLEKEQLAITVSQSQFNLHEVLNKAGQFQFKTIENDMQQYKTVIQYFVQQLSSH
ncbi:MAG: glycosyltransferase [Pseudobacter sp.]|uniref:glycosyltransferase n=1 Tax=Pseudobacter sp. TaxID=2045420 RepID=UPI003F7F975D